MKFSSFAHIHIHKGDLARVPTFGTFVSTNFAIWKEFQNLSPLFDFGSSLDLSRMAKRACTTDYDDDDDVLVGDLSLGDDDVFAECDVECDELVDDVFVVSAGLIPISET